MFIKALGDAAHIFKAAKEAFDDIPFAIKPYVVGNLLFIRGPARDNRDRAIIFDRLTNSAAVIGFVGANRQRRRSVPEKIRQRGRIMGLAACEHEFQRSPASIDHGMELRCATSA